MKRLEVTFDREEDGRWIADIEEIPGALAYGKTRDEAAMKACAIALHVIAERTEEGDQSFAPAVHKIFDFA